MNATIAPVRDALENARERLLASRTAGGHWEGRLASSALATATAILALRTVGRECDGVAVDGSARLVDEGTEWLLRTQNPDGGWGDTPDNASNISTSALCWAALGLVPRTTAVTCSLKLVEDWITREAGGLSAAHLARVLEARYGKDRTFSVPILTALAIAGRLGPDGWRAVPQLPFELAACPHQWFAWLRLPVVSYALPALIAIGQVRHAARPTRNPILRAVRSALRGRTLDTLAAIQPSSGGFLEATPLTSFVVMSLAHARLADHPVVQKGLRFITASAREDGSWPIDTNLATWTTTLAIDALGAGDGLRRLSDSERQAIASWLLKQQFREEHPYTHAAPGGWAWTDLPGGVPDADDTPGALLALARLGGADDEGTRAAARAGIRWLVDLQNRDGGMPTFCRGWTGLPFDRSGADLTAHAVRAWLAWRPALDGGDRIAVDRALAAAARYLVRVQRADGSFEPLWFGNERTAGELNLTYGTAKVLPALVGLAAAGHDQARAAATRAAAWLVSAQHPDGGWSGGPFPEDRGLPPGAIAGGTIPDAGTATGDSPSPSIEETALAVAALAAADLDEVDTTAAVNRGVAWLRQATDGGRTFPASPIGLYFARLWYSEQLYPLIFTVAAFEAAAARARRRGHELDG
ncbi:MAG TPA: prenyltransferase/squalene oxidase repeat-containing protein [Vicinamibacterales bacterium]